MLVAKNGSVGTPLYQSLLDNNSGNINSENRKYLLANVIRVIGKHRIGMIVGDREFVGIEWIKCLKDNNIYFCMRVSKMSFAYFKKRGLLFC